MSGGDGRVHNQSSGTVFGPHIQAGVVEQLTVVHRERPPVPRDVPGPAHGFVNRTAELAALDAAFDAALARGREGAGGPTLLVLSGDGGMGKSALSYEWAARRVERFPDGQLHVDLADARRGGAVDLGSVAAGLARRLGVGADFVPADPAGRAAVYRSATAGRHGLLLVLENAEHASEVRALLPRHGMVLVTSRRPLGTLRMDGARPVPVGGLDAAACRELVRSWLDESEVGEAALGGLLRVCEGRPLTLRAVGERLLDGSGAGVERVVAELTREGGRTTMRDAFDRVHASFPPATRRLYRLLGALPGPTFPRELALSLGGEDAAAGLAALEAARLVSQRAPGHYAFHDEVRAHAATLPDAGERAAVREAGSAFALAVCELVDRAVLGERLRLTGEEPRPEVAVLPELSTSGAALAWMEREHAGVLALLRAAAEDGRHERVWLMCQALWAYYHSRKPYGDWIESHRLGVVAARWAGRPDAELRMINQLARARVELREYAAAEETLEPAEALLTAVPQRQLRGVLHETRGVLARAVGRPAEAAAHFRAAKDANAGDERGMAVQGYQLAGALLDLARPEAALAELDEALARVPGERNAALHARIGIVRGEALRAAGRATEAAAALEAAAGLAERLGLWSKARAALLTLAELARGPEAAARVAARLAEASRRAGVPPG
ncbi:hypothetical protein SAMN06297387_102224 [Streptomyces zhaozhouensis]|uniref:Tetratricopeptide repeat-containing protein n=1 Tax=Streptomyces zhaozhouensis TaxID=1300267 RepID=A0A286DPZ5_9ACTN|nr:hypothetical protein [Streptomyces zhaozhouensis]SOD60701.1 hypothetical protein SAMN06297387_102224 [Streptomyces zhaozhouensis]